MQRRVLGRLPRQPSDHLASYKLRGVKFGLDWIGFPCPPSDHLEKMGVRFGLDWFGSVWIGLDWFGLVWIGLV